MKRIAIAIVSCAALTGAAVVVKYFYNEIHSLPNPTVAVEATNAPIVEAVVVEEKPVAPVTWQQVNSQPVQDAAYWEADRKKREAQIAADLAARKNSAAKIQQEQAAREAQQAKSTKGIIERQQDINSKDWKPTVHRP